MLSSCGTPEIDFQEAVAVAVEACAEDTKGQTCYICTQSLHWKTKEGLVRMCACRGTAGFAHVSCLAEQAKILCDEVEANNLGKKVRIERFARWYACSLCEQDYHGVVKCALGWACWKTYVGRSDECLLHAIRMLGNGLLHEHHFVEALSVQEAELAIHRRIGASEYNMLAVQCNIATSYEALGRHEEAMSLQRDVYSGCVRLLGEEHGKTLLVANNYAESLISLERFEEAKVLLHKTIPVARRVLGENHDLPLGMRSMYAQALCRDTAATLGDLREAVTTYEEIERTARRVLGGAHPEVRAIQVHLRRSRATLRAREAPPTTKSQN